MSADKKRYVYLGYIVHTLKIKKREAFIRQKAAELAHQTGVAKFFGWLDKQEAKSQYIGRGDTDE